MIILDEILAGGVITVLVVVVDAKLVESLVDFHLVACISVIVDFVDVISHVRRGHNLSEVSPVIS